MQCLIHVSCYANGSQAAAIALQAAVRGRHTRIALAGQRDAARALQAVYRGLRTRCELGLQAAATQPAERSKAFGSEPKRKQGRNSSGSESKRKEHGVEETRLSGELHKPASEPNMRGGFCCAHSVLTSAAKCMLAQRFVGSRRSLTSVTKRSTCMSGKRLKFKAGGTKLPRRRTPCESPSRAPVRGVDRVRECCCAALLERVPLGSRSRERRALGFEG